MIMSASEDGKIRLYDLRGGEETLAIESSGMFYYWILAAIFNQN